MFIKFFMELMVLGSHHAYELFCSKLLCLHLPSLFSKVIVPYLGRLVLKVISEFVNFWEDI